MKVTHNKVISIHYSVTDDNGQVVDSNMDYEPLEYLQGKGKMLPALEAKLEGAILDETRNIMLKPAQAYGDYDNDLIVEVDKNSLAGSAAELKTGMVLKAADGSEVEIIRVLPDKVVVNKNHPLAGKQLHFTIKIAAIRNATLDEMLYGHPLQAVEICDSSCSCHQ